MAKLNNVVYNHLPKILRETVRMKSANSVCKIYKGEFVIKTNTELIDVIGLIYFGWMGNRFGVNFKGQTLIQDSALFQHALNSSTVEIFINGEFLGKGILNRLDFSSDYFNGRFLGEVIRGDKDKEVNKILFALPNLIPLHGIFNVVKTSSKNVQISGNRIVLRNKGYTITLDLRFDSSKMFDSLKDKGGFGIMYSGEIVKDSNIMTHGETYEVLMCLSRFLSFINGRKISALFIEGYMNQDLLWKDYTSYKNEPYKEVNHWTPNFWTDHHTEMWVNFSDHYFDEKHKTILSSVIYWYIEANGNSGIEVKSVLAQSALELIFNWFNEKGMIDDINSDVHSTGSGKLRAILEIIHYSKDVPNSLKKLSAFLESYKVEKQINKKTNEEFYPTKDACLIITKIRNTLVHADKANRKKLARIPNNVLSESVNLSLLYIEMAILYIHGYKGKFKNRCVPMEWDGQEGFVPWIENK